MIGEQARRKTFLLKVPDFFNKNCLRFIAGPTYWIHRENSIYDLLSNCLFSINFSGCIAIVYFCTRYFFIGNTTHFSPEIFESAIWLATERRLCARWLSVRPPLSLMEIVYKGDSPVYAPLNAIKGVCHDLYARNVAVAVAVAANGQVAWFPLTELPHKQTQHISVYMLPNLCLKFSFLIPNRRRWLMNKQTAYPGQDLPSTSRLCVDSRELSAT